MSLNFNRTAGMDPEILIGSLAIFNVVFISFILTGTPVIWALIFGIVVLVFCYIIGFK